MTKNNTTPSASTSKGFKIFNKEISLSLEDKIAYLLLLVLIFLIYTIRSKFASIPFERDEGIYSYMGKLLNEGKIPYKDFYEFKFPGIFYMYAFFVGLFGDTVEGMHKGFMWMNIFTMLFIFFAVRNLFDSIPAIIAAATFSIVSLTPALSGFTVQSEHGIAFFVSVSLFIYSLIKLYNKNIFYFLFGAMLCMAVMIKQTSVFLALWGGLILVLDYLTQKEKNLKKSLITFAIFILGAVSIVLLFAILIISKDCFKEMIYWSVEISKYYSGMMKLEDGIQYFKYTRDAITKDYMFFWGHALLSIAVIILPTLKPSQKLFTITLAIASFLTITPGYFFYGHYWIQTLPGLAVLSGITAYGIIKFFETKLKFKPKTVNLIYLVFFGIFFTKHINANKSYYFYPNYDLILRTTYGNNPFPESMQIANFINQNSKPEDGLALIGSEPQIYFYTKKKSPSRHAYFTALVTSVKEHKEWQREFSNDVEKAKPKHIVFFNHQLSLLVQPNTDNYIFTWANKYINENYKVVGYADMINNGYQTNYVWGEQNAATYHPQSQTYAVVFERKN